MNRYAHLSKDRIARTYKRGVKEFLLHLRPSEIEIIEHLSGDKYTVYTTKPEIIENKEKVFWIYNIKNQGYVYAKEADMKPESVREKLHNIQEAKNFVEKHTKIDREKLIKEYQKERLKELSIQKTTGFRRSSIWSESYVENLQEKYAIQLIRELSDTKYQIFYNTIQRKKSYLVWHKETEEGVVVPEDIVQPKSVREALHNIEENKIL